MLIRQSRLIAVVWTLVGVLGLVFWWMAFHYAPRELEMGDVQRIFYIHLPLAWTSMVAFIISALMHGVYLWNGKDRWLHYGWAQAWTGTVMSVLVLATGMCWAKPAWGSWWPWEPRLTSTFLMVVMYAAYLVLYDVLAQEGNFRPIAVYNLLCGLNIPIVMIAPRIWRGLHPVVIQAGKIQLEPRMWHTVLMGWVWTLGIYLIWTWSASRIALTRSFLQTQIWSQRGSFHE